MRNKKLATVLLLILPLFLTACSLSDLPLIGRFFGGGTGGGGNPKEPVTLSFWGLFEEVEVMESLINKYSEEYPNVTINYDDRSIVGPVDYKNTIFARAGQDGAPDIAMVHSSWVSDLRGSLTPSTTISSNDYQEKFYPVASQDAVFGGDVYAVPLDYDGLALIYNKDHFAEIDQVSPPTSWEEFRSIADRLTIREENGNIYRAGAAIGSANNIDFSSDILAAMLYQSGVLLPFETRFENVVGGGVEENYVIDSKSAYDVLTFYTNFVTEDQIWSDRMPEAAATFAQDRASMIFVPSWILLDILYYRPDMNIGVAPMPQALGESQYVYLSSYWMVGVPSGGSNPSVAWDFLRFLTQEENQLMFYNAASEYRDFGRPYSSPVLLDEVIPGSIIDSYLDMATRSRSSLLSARSGNRDYVDVINEAINSVLYNSVEPRDAMRTVKSNIEALR